MPDITMCKGTDCKLRDECYRYTAIPSEYRQSWFIEVPFKNNECDEFMQKWKKEQ